MLFIGAHFIFKYWSSLYIKVQGENREIWGLCIGIGYTYNRQVIFCKEAYRNEK